MTQYDSSRQTLDKDQVLREQRKSEFIQKVNAEAALAQFPPEVGSQLPYSPGSAAIYGKVAWPEAIKKYQDGFGIGAETSLWFEALSSELSGEDVQKFIDFLNSRLSQYNIFVALAKPNDPTEIISTSQGQQVRETPNFLPAHAFAAYKDNTAPITGFVRGQKFEVATLPKDYKGFILVDENLAQEDPANTVIKVLHELGHADELFHGLSFTAKVGHDNKSVKLRTEYYSTRFALKICLEQYLKTGDKRWIIAGAYQAAIYSRVMGK